MQRLLCRFTECHAATWPSTALSTRYWRRSLATAVRSGVVDADHPPRANPLRRRFTQPGHPPRSLVLSARCWRPTRPGRFICHRHPGLLYFIALSLPARKLSCEKSKALFPSIGLHMSSRTGQLRDTGCQAYCFIEGYTAGAPFRAQTWVSDLRPWTRNSCTWMLSGIALPVARCTFATSGTRCHDWRQECSAN